MPFCVSCGKPLVEDAEYCIECGAKVPTISELNQELNQPVHEKTCPQCGERMPEDMFYCLNCGHQFFGKNIDLERPNQQGRYKNKWVALLLCIFFGYIGAHRFYEGKVITGILYLCTCGFCGIGWIIDIFLLIIKPNPYLVL